MIYGYIRVSTDKQNTANQEFEITNFSNKNQIKVDIWIKETISSRQPLEKRKLGKLLKRLSKGDILIASELSRLGRNLLQVMSILNSCMNKEVQVWTIKDNYKLGADVQSKVLAFAFGLSAEIERQLISQRTKEALARVKAEGKRLGRVKGSKNLKRKLDGKAEKIREFLSKGLSKNRIAHRLHVSYATLDKFIKQHIII